MSVSEALLAPDSGAHSCAHELTLAAYSLDFQNPQGQEAA